MRIYGIGYGFMMAILIASPGWAKCDTTQPSQTPTRRYVIKGGTVYDTKSHLTWSRCSVGQNWQEGVGCVGAVKTMTWFDAKGRASGGWRVPTKDELETLFSPTCKNPAINEEAFPGMEPDKLTYWTSTEDGASNAWAVAFDDSGAYPTYPSWTFAVRLVRNGQLSARPPHATKSGG